MSEPVRPPVSESELASEPPHVRPSGLSPSVRPSVHPFVSPSVRPSVRPSLRPHVGPFVIPTIGSPNEIIDCHNGGSP